MKTRSASEVIYLRKKYHEEKDPRVKERILAVIYWYEGRSFTKIGKLLNRHRRTISCWIKRYDKKRDIDVLRDKPRSGRPPNLDNEQKKELDEIILNKMPCDFGYNWEIWDIKTVKDLVENRYNVTFSYSGLWKIVRKRLRFSYGKPYQKDARQDPLKVKIFLEEELPEVDKRIENLLNAGKKVLVGFEDESHHQIKPNVQRALFKGKSITVETIDLRGEKKTAFGFLSLSGSLHVEYYDTGNADNFIDYCKSLEEKYKDYDYIFIFFDNAKYHGNAKFRGSLKVREYWKESKIVPVFIPPYSPKLNPIEQVWRVIKKHLGKHLFRKIDDLTDCAIKFIGQKKHQFLSIVSGFAEKHFSSSTLSHHSI